MSQQPLRLLLIEDSELDATLIVSMLQSNGYVLESKRVDTEESMKKALEDQTWDIVISDFTMPKLKCLDALKLLKENHPDIPFILVSGAIGEETAVSVMKHGASDYIMKNNLSRLPEAVKRELEESKIHLKLKETEERYYKLVESSPDGILILNHHLIEFINKAGYQSLGAENSSEIIGKSFINFLQDNSRGLFSEFIENLEENIQNPTLSNEGKFVRLDGEVRDADIMLTPFIIKNKTQIQVIFRDITERKRTEKLAYFDPITGLTSRYIFTTILTKFLAQAYRENEMLAVVFFDLDKFKLVNDTYGHEIGDYILQIIGQRLLTSLRPSDVVSRFGGDEFVLGLPNMESKAQLEKRMEDLIKILQKPILLDCNEFNIKLSMGVSFFPNHGDDVQTLVNKADLAMYQAKKHKNKLQFFDNG